jgi:hypothetical protein
VDCERAPGLRSDRRGIYEQWETRIGVKGFDSYLGYHLFDHQEGGTMFYLSVFLAFTAGIAVAGILFRGSRSRSLLSIRECRNCLNTSEAAGLLASVVIQKMPGIIPRVLVETDKTIVFRHPRPKHSVHYLFVPKKDIRNIGELTDEDKDYIIDLFSTVGAVVNKQRIKNYALWTNGPGKQDIAYLHFHLKAE